MRTSSWRSWVTSSRSESVLLVGQCGEPVPGLPELGVEALLDQPAEQLDRRSLRADNRVADQPRDNQVVAHPPERDPIVPADQELGQLGERLVLPPVAVELDDGEAFLAQAGRERLPERRRDAPDLAEA